MSKEQRLIHTIKFAAHVSWRSSSWGSCLITEAASLSQELSVGRLCPLSMEIPRVGLWPHSCGPGERERGMGQQIIVHSYYHY